MNILKQFASTLICGFTVLAAAHVGAQTVRINGITCAPGSTATFTLPTGDINVQASGACIATSTPAPTLSALMPMTAAPGDTVTATGSNFVNGQTTVTVGMAIATGVSANATSLTFVVPSVAAGNHNVVITVNGQSSSPIALNVTAVTPTITSLTSPSNPIIPGSLVTVNGTNFASGATATLNGSAVPLTFVSGTTATFVVPAIAQGSYPVIVTVGGNPSMSSTLIVGAANPTINANGIAPTSSSVGGQVTVSGTGLAPGATVTVGGVAASVVGTPTGTTLIFTVPTVGLGAQAVVVTVLTATATSAITVTTSTPTPTISACSGTVAGTFSITGTNFAAGASVTIGGNSVVSPTVTGTTSIAGNVPSAITAAGTPPAIVTVSSVASAPVNCTISVVPLGISAYTQSADLTPNAIPFPSKARQSTSVTFPPHVGLNGANGRFNPPQQQAWWAATTFCSNATPAIQRFWVHNLDFATYRGTNTLEYFGINAHEALSYAFVAPAEGSGQGAFAVLESTAADFVGTFISISSQPCDLDVTKVADTAPYSPCYSSRNGINTLQYKATTGAVSFSICKLNPGQTYYFNYRNQYAVTQPNMDSCQATNGGTSACGGTIQIN